MREERNQVSTDYTLGDILPEEYFQASFTHEAMWTRFQLIAVLRKDSGAASQLGLVAQEAFGAIDRLEAKISTWRINSQISRVNYEGATNPVGVAADVFGMVRKSVEIYHETGGAFDVTVGPLLELWRKCRDENRLPSDAEIEAARARMGSDKLALDRELNTVAFTQPHMRLELNAIAKGLALDEAARILHDYGISSAFLDGGGSSYLAVGAPPGTPGWKVRVKHPYNESWIEQFVLRDESLSASGHVLDAFEFAGKRYGHIINPSTGMPVEGMVMAMALAPTAMETDALSTAFFVLGEPGVREYCRKHPEVRAVLVPESGTQELVPVRINFEN